MRPSLLADFEISHTNRDEDAMTIKQLYFHETGPLVEFDGELLWIEDLNPHVTTKWRMSRFEMVVFGLRAIWSALTASKAGL